jgi:muramidase (phage lysozyme)
VTNLDAFLTMIARSEGTQDIPGGDDGYRVIVGSTPEKPILFDSYADHPRQRIQLSPGLSSTAAGRYQILERYFDAYKAMLGLPDFSPKSQDSIAIQMIRERQAFADVCAGRIDEAVGKCSSIWASLPGNNYAQHENSLTALRSAFIDAGGTLA